MRNPYYVAHCNATEVFCASGPTNTVFESGGTYHDLVLSKQARMWTVNIL